MLTVNVFAGNQIMIIPKANENNNFMLKIKNNTCNKLLNRIGYSAATTSGRSILIFLFVR